MSETAPDPRAWLDQVDAIHNQVIRNDQRAEWQRLTAEHDAMPAATTALRAVLDLHAPAPGWPQVCVECNRVALGASVHSTYPCPTVAAITTALEDA